jgi:hypothetical protein
MGHTASPHRNNTHPTRKNTRIFIQLVPVDGIFIAIDLLLVSVNVTIINLVINVNAVLLPN